MALNMGQIFSSALYNQ